MDIKRIKDSNFLRNLFWVGVGSGITSLVFNAFLDTFSDKIKSDLNVLSEKNHEISSQIRNINQIIEGKDDITRVFVDSLYQGFDEFSEPNVDCYEDPRVEMFSDRIYKDYRLAVVATPRALGKERNLVYLLSTLERNLGKIHKPLIQDTRFVFVDTETHGSFNQDILLRPFVHASSISDLRTVLLSTEKEYTPGDLAHEFAHVKSSHTEGFDEEWDEIIFSHSQLLLDRLQEYKKRGEMVDFPDFGFMSSYGSTISEKIIDGKKVYEFQEDVPEYLNAIYEIDSPFSKVKDDKTIYSRKLWLLKQKDFISEEQYQKASNEIYKRK